MRKIGLTQKANEIFNDSNNVIKFNSTLFLSKIVTIITSGLNVSVHSRDDGRPRSNVAKMSFNLCPNFSPDWSLFVTICASRRPESPDSSTLKTV